MATTVPAYPPATRRPLVGVPAAWAAVVLVLTLTPAQDMPRTPDWQLLAFDTASHAFVFAVLSLTSYFSATRQRRFPTLRRRAGLLVGLGCVLFGALIEVLQMAMQMGRHGEWSDLLSDAIGAGVGLLVGWGLRRWW